MKVLFLIVETSFLENYFALGLTLCDDVDDDAVLHLRDYRDADVREHCLRFSYCYR